MTIKSLFIRVRPWLIESVVVRVHPWLMRSVLVCIGLWLIVAGVAAAERPHFDSQRRDGAISVDGRFDDWYGNLAPFANEPVAIQFLNDGDFLYVRLTASDAATRMQIMRQGLTIWFDPAGGTKKRFGIMYPVVISGGPDGDQRGGRRGRLGEGASEDLPTPADRVNVIGPRKEDARSLTRDHLSGIEVAIHAEQGTVQYELKVPLAVSADHPYAIGAAPGKTIGFGLETPKMQQRSFGAGPGGGFGGGGGGGGMGGGRGRGGGMGGRGGGGRGGRGGDERSFQPPKPLNGWATLTIAPVR